MSYAKSLVAVLVAIASALAGYLTDNVITPAEWVNVALAGGTAAVVFTAPNVPGAAYTKSILALLMAGLTAIASFITDGAMTGSEWLQVIVAVGGAVAVLGVPNKDTAPASTARAA